MRPLVQGADPDNVELDIGDLRARLQAHVFKGAPFRLALAFIGNVFGIGNAACFGYDVLRARAPGDDRGQGGSIELHDAIKMGAIIGVEAVPVAACCIHASPFGALGLPMRYS